MLVCNGFGGADNVEDGVGAIDVQLACAEEVEVRVIDEEGVCGGGHGC